MAGLRKIRIVQNDPRGRPTGVDVFDADTGEKLLNVYRIEIDLSRREAHVRLTMAVEWEYEGPADVVPMEARPQRIDEPIPDDPDDYPVT